MPARVQRAHRLVAIDAVRQLHDEHEPAAPCFAVVLAGKRQALDAGERLAVGRGDALPRRRANPSRFSCATPERAGDIREPVVEAEPVVVEPAHVRGAALVALGVDPLLDARRRRS